MPLTWVTGNRYKSHMSSNGFHRRDRGSNSRHRHQVVCHEMSPTPYRLRYRTIGFLLNNFCTLLSEKSLILQISLKSALEKFSILLFHIALGVCYLAMVLSDLCLFKTPNTC